MRNFKKNLVFCLIVSILLSCAFQVQAIELLYPPVPGAEAPQDFIPKIQDGTYDQGAALALYVKYAYHLAVMLAGFAAFYTLVSGIAQYFFHTWTGAFGAAGSALSTISAGLLGTAVILSSYLLVKTIDPAILIANFGLEGSEIEVPDIEEFDRAEVTFAEVPTGDLIEEVLARANIVTEQAKKVFVIAKQVKEQSACLKFLAEQCSCEHLYVENCECETLLECKECKEAYCEGDPCDVEGKLCGTGTGNIKEAIDEEKLRLDILIENLAVEKANLVSVKDNLNRANLRLKFAEALIRDRQTSEVFNYMSFVGEKQFQENQDKGVEIEELWPHEASPAEQRHEGGPVIGFPCNSDCKEESSENTPCCMLCHDTLVCWGNDSRTCGTDNIFPAPGTISNGGWSRQTLKEHGYEYTIDFNGTVFPIPFGGVQYCASPNKVGCNYYKCEE